MKTISLAALTLALALGALAGCAEKKEPSEKAQEAETKPVESVIEKPADKALAGPSAAPEAKEKAVEKKEPVAAAPVKEASKEPVVSVKEVLKEAAVSVKDIEAGALVFKAKCAMCHGAEGRGTTMAPGFNGNGWIKSASNGEIAGVIKNGRKGAEKKYPNFFSDMPASKTLAERDVNALVEYMRSIN